jgi:hypothetical protein
MTDINIPRRPQNVRAVSKNLAGAPMAGETPSEIVAGSANDTATAVDAKGRAITVKRLNALQYYRLTKAMGPTATNAATMDLAVIASSVQSIDDDTVLPPGTELQVEHLMQRLDFHGLSAAGEALKKLSEADDNEAPKN